MTVISTLVRSENTMADYCKYWRNERQFFGMLTASGIDLDHSRLKFLGQFHVLNLVGDKTTVFFKTMTLTLFYAFANTKTLHRFSKLINGQGFYSYIRNQLKR